MKGGSPRLALLSVIAARERRERMRDGRFRLAGGVVGLLLAVSLALGWAHFTSVRAQHEAADRAERELWLGKDDMNPHGAAHYGTYVFKPRSALSAFDQGLDPYLGVSLFLEAHKQNFLQQKPAADATEMQGFGELTAAVTLLVLVPLLLVLLTFDVFSGEREQGTLRQAMSLGVSRGELAAGKALGVATTLALLLVPAAALGALATVLSGESGLLAPQLPRIALLTAAFLLYFGLWLALGLLVSASAPSSRLALVALTGLWFAATLLVPRLAADRARSAHPSPTAGAFADAIEAEKKRLPDGHSVLPELEARLLKKYGVSSVAELPVNPRGVALEEGEARDTALYGRQVDRVFDSFERQNRYYESAALLSPAIAMQSLSRGLAGTDFAHHLAFSRAAEAYRREMVHVLNHDITVNQKIDDADYVGTRALWEKVPPFRYTPPGVSWVLGRHARSAALLAAWFAAVTLAAGVVLARVRLP